MFHIPTPERSDMFKIVACADAFPESAKIFADEYSVRAYQTSDELLNDENIDLVIIATKPPTTHHALAMLAFKKGKHVVVEKPMAEIYRSTLPFFLVLLLTVLLITYVPGLITGVN